MSKQTPSTLFELLENYQVEIPRIQRDYAQGRQDSHAKKVRFHLLHDMKKAVLESSCLDLSFIYGKAEDKKFIPIDGQQRLTTLFLLYLYAFRHDESKTPLFYHFTYETRITSREFFKRLIKNRAVIFVSDGKPSEEIEDSDWFLSSWIHDPTITSALIMLDDIQEIFHDVDDLANRLTKPTENPITFEFLEMKDFGMEDNLYIKLNARGKSLTEFENFKAQLIGRMKELNLSYQTQFESSLDGSWTDCFWNQSKKDFDRTYYTFFGVLFMNYGIILDDNNWTTAFDYQKIEEDLFDTIFYTLNFLSANPTAKASRFLLDALSEERTYANRILFHAVSSYLSKTKGVAKASFSQWLRIIQNLTLNSDTNSPLRYHNAIVGISALTSSWNDLVSSFAGKNKVTGFNQQQIKEEQIKAKIIIKNPSFAKAIYAAEEHPYFTGQIRSALYLAKTDSGYDEKQFQYYWEKISALFDPAKPKHGNLLRRALLTFGDYTLPVSQFKTLCVDDPKEAASTPSLKSLFSNCSSITKQLLDTLTLTRDIKQQLIRIVKNSTVPKTDWRYCFIKYPVLFNYMSVSHLRLRMLHGEMHLITNKLANGYNYDLFLSALCEELEQRGIKDVLRDNELGTWATHCLYIKDYSIFFREGKFYIYNEKNKEVFQSKSQNPISETADFFTD